MKQKKYRFYYYEDEDVYKYISTLPHSYRSSWVRDATRKQFKKLSTKK